MPTIRDRQTSWTTLTDAPDVVEAARRQAEQRIDLIKQTERYTEDHKRKLIGEQREALEATGREQLARVQAARDTLLAQARELGVPAGDTAAQLLAETRAGRAWDRVRQQLDAGRHWSAVIDEATQGGDADSIRALAAELPAYLKAAAAGAKGARGGGASFFGDGAEALDTEQLSERLDVALVRVLGDDQGAGTAARLRLHVATRFPLAQQVIESAVLGSDLTRAMSISYARKAAEAVEAKLDGQPQGDREQFAASVAQQIPRH